MSRHAMQSFTLSLPICVRALALASMLAAGSVAEAQDGRSACRTTPPAAQGEGAPKSEGQSLTEALDSCNSVLTPPRVGDGDLVEPAPDAGKTPVITPGDLPPQGNPSNNPG